MGLFGNKDKEQSIEQLKKTVKGWQIATITLTVSLLGLAIYAFRS